MNGLHRNELNKILSGSDAKEGLLNLKEAADLLGLTEEEMKYFVSQGKIPAYKIGGEFLRFKKDQIEALRGRIKILRHQSVPIEKISPADEAEKKTRYSVWDRIRDFLYFNDFYILAAILIALLVYVIVRKR